MLTIFLTALITFFAMDILPSMGVVFITIGGMMIMAISATHSRFFVVAAILMFALAVISAVIPDISQDERIVFAIIVGVGVYLLTRRATRVVFVITDRTPLMLRWLLFLLL